MGLLALFSPLAALLPLSDAEAGGADHAFADKL